MSETPAGHRPDPDRRAFRAFVRTHHPDVGGDPERFRDGLAAFHGRTAGTARTTASTSTSTPASTSTGTTARTTAGTAVPAEDDPRLDGPITAVPGGAIHRLGRFGRRLARRYDPRPGSARVR